MASFRASGMSANAFVTSRRVRLVVAVLYPVLLMVFAPRALATAPLLFIALGLPLVFRLVPRNWLYGMRTPHTLRGSEETWYIQNTITGWAMVIIGLGWLTILAFR
ncbi:MAG: SdpI family protein [Micropepsaceae bacterium]